MEAAIECVICLEEIDKNQIGSLPCQHLFCVGCIKDWGSREATCPTCRAEFNEIIHQYNGNEERITIRPKFDTLRFLQRHRHNISSHRSNAPFQRFPSAPPRTSPSPRRNGFRNQFQPIPNLIHRATHQFQSVFPPNLPFPLLNQPIRPEYHPIDPFPAAANPPASSSEDIWSDLYTYFFENDEQFRESQMTLLQHPLQLIPAQGNSSSNDRLQQPDHPVMDPFLQEAINLLMEDETMMPFISNPSSMIQTRRYREVIDLTGNDEALNFEVSSGSVSGRKRPREL